MCDARVAARKHMQTRSKTGVNWTRAWYINNTLWHDDVIKWKHFPRNWPLVWGIHRSPVNSPHKGQWRGALMFSLIYKRLSKSWLGWWFETPSHPLWRIVMEQHFLNFFHTLHIQKRFKRVDQLTRVKVFKSVAQNALKCVLSESIAFGTRIQAPVRKCLSNYHQSRWCYDNVIITARRRRKVVWT